MKILTIVWSIGIGGTERAAVNYAIAYKLTGNDSMMLVLGEGHERYTDLEEAGVDTILVTKSGKPIGNILSECKTWSSDIIHIHNYNDGLLEFIKAVKGATTMVVETNVFSRPNFSPGYQIVDLSMQLSAWGYWKYVRWMKGAKYCPQVAVVPYIVDGSKFKSPCANTIQSFLRSYNIPSNAYVIGRLGQPHSSKWDVRLLAVIQQTIHENNNIYYLLVGVPDNLVDMFKTQTDFFNSRVIQIDKIVGDDNLSMYYHSLNCFAHISKIGESFGYVLAEALICKIPVITMLTPLQDNAQYEVVGHKYGGFCVTNTTEFVEAVHELYRNKDAEASIKSNLSDWIERRFSYKIIIAKQIKVYNELLAGNRIPFTDVKEVIQTCLELYKDKAWLTSFLLKFINSPLLYRVVTRLKTRMRST